GHAPEHRRRHRRALRAGPAARSGTGRPGRRAPRVRLCRPGDGRPLVAAHTQGGNAAGFSTATQSRWTGFTLSTLRRIESMKISRQAYADMFGPTVGDRVRLADTELWLEVEHDYTTYGDEVKFGGGKVI